MHDRRQGLVRASGGSQRTSEVAVDVDELRLDSDRALVLFGGVSPAALRRQHDAEIAEGLGIVRPERHDLPELRGRFIEAAELAQQIG